MLKKQTLKIVLANTEIIVLIDTHMHIDGGNGSKIVKKNFGLSSLLLSFSYIKN